MIYRIASGKSDTPVFKGAVTSVSVVGAWLRNEMEEGRVAKALRGPQCRGTHYNGLQTNEVGGIAWCCKLFAVVTIIAMVRRMMT